MAGRFERLSKAGERIAQLRKYEQKLRREILIELGVQLCKAYNCRSGEIELTPERKRELEQFIGQNAVILAQYLRCKLDQPKENPESLQRS